MSDETRDPFSYLPLTSVVFEILLALADEERHGYAIMQEVDRRTNGLVKLRPGTLYRAVNRMLEEGLISEATRRPDPDLDDQRRRYYGLTDLGRKVARAEAFRLQGAVSSAFAKKLLDEGEVL